MWLLFDPYQCSYQYIINLNYFNINLSLGVDGISLFFIYLTSFIIPLCMVFTFKSRLHFFSNINYYLATLLSIEILLLFVFMVMDIFLFYIFFEAILIPFFMYIGICGYRARRIHAAYLLFFYTIFGSFSMLIGIFLIYLSTGTTDLLLLSNFQFNESREKIIWILFFISFAIKVPMFPFHIWLPEAHVEASTEGSVILAGILLKLGTYGILRFLFLLFPCASFYYSPLVIVLSLLSIFYTSITTLRQIDIKRVIAYSSISHMNMCILGLFSFDINAVVGSILLMIGHGLVSSGLFFLIGMLYDRYKTKLIKYYSGLLQTMPVFSFFFLFLFVVILVFQELVIFCRNY